MANSDTRFLYTDDDGNLCIVIPADNTDLTFIDTFDRIKVIDDRIFKKNYL